jgi:hypothetical protein
VTVSADVNAANALSGVFTFDNSVHAAFTGVVFDSGGVNSRVEISFAASGGAACSLRLVHGLVP